ncbi:hypothetical protein [Streptomyces filamentosus]|uniref:hypothetical protein n=1 Tax=Streptomyces filamentosus TaxID=67294 RepID=UPI0034081B95
MTNYKTARQRHFAEILTQLQENSGTPSSGALSNFFRAGKTTTTGLWWIALPGQAEHWYSTSEAERLAGGICYALGIIWEPVAAPGGEAQLAEALALMEQRREQT